MRWPRALALALLLAMSVPTFAAERVRVAVLGLFHPKQVVIEVSPSSPMIVESEHSQFIAGVGVSQRIVLSWSKSQVIARSEHSQLKGNKIIVTARSGSELEFFLSVPGKLRRRYRGRLEVIASGNELVPVVEMDLETAVASVVAAELPKGTPVEALKAQAVVSRSYLAAGGHRHPLSDFCDTTHCQFLREPPSPDSRAALAARETQGLVLAWKSKPFAAMFSASCGGRTHSLAEIGSAPLDYPYYSVECTYCRRSPEKWSTTITKEDAAALASHDEASRIKTGRRLGWHAVQSNTYERKSASGAVDVSGVGRGHGVGLCQRGAVGMARSGADFRAILAHYFPNTTIEAGR